MSRCRWCERTAQNSGFCGTHYSRYYRHPKGEDEFWGFVHKTAGCWNWSGPTRRGYARVSILDLGTGEFKRHYAGLWIYEKLNGSIGDMGLLLTCGKRSCVNPEHMTKIGRSARAALQRMWSAS